MATLKEIKVSKEKNKQSKKHFTIEKEITYNNEEERIEASKRMQQIITYKASAYRERVYHIHYTDNSIQLKYRKAKFEPLI